MKSMKEQYGSKKGKSVFYASMNKGVIKGVEKKKEGGSMKKPPKTSPEKDSPIFSEKGLREKLKEKGPEMMEKYFSEPREKTISLSEGGMTKKRRKLQEVEIESDIKKPRPTFPGKPSGPPPVKGPESQGMRKYAKGGFLLTPQQKMQSKNAEKELRNIEQRKLQRDVEQIQMDRNPAQMKKGGIAKGCGRVMNDRRKLTKYY
jgi:hypothetical protein